MIHLFIPSYFLFFLTRVYLIQVCYTVLILIIYVQPLVAHELKIYLFIYL